MAADPYGLSRAEREALRDVAAASEAMTRGAEAQAQREAAARLEQEARAEHAAAERLSAELDAVKAEIADHRHASASVPALDASLPQTLRERRAGAADPWLGSVFTMNSLRGVVSKKKRRFQKDGFDLDLSYITPQIIAMGFPSVGAEQRYRNPMSEVQDFFQAYHPRHSMVVNLCCERGYAATEFEHAVAFPFMDRECRAGSGCDCRPRL